MIRVQSTLSTESRLPGLTPDFIPSTTTDMESLPPAYAPARRVQRVLAYLLDLACVAAVIGLVWRLRPSPVLAAIALVETATVLTLVRARTGKTPGLLVTGTTAIRHTTNHAPGLVRQLVHSLLMGALHLTVFGPLLVVAFQRSGQDWADRIAGTAVVDLHRKPEVGSANIEDLNAEGKAKQISASPYPDSSAGGYIDQSASQNRIITGLPSGFPTPSRIPGYQHVPPKTSTSPLPSRSPQSFPRTPDRPGATPPNSSPYPPIVTTAWPRTAQQNSEISARPASPPGGARSLHPPPRQPLPPPAAYPPQSANAPSPQPGQAPSRHSGPLDQSQSRSTTQQEATPKVLNPRRAAPSASEATPPPEPLVSTSPGPSTPRRAVPSEPQNPPSASDAPPSPRPAAHLLKKQQETPLPRSTRGTLSRGSGPPSSSTPIAWLVTDSGQREALDAVLVLGSSPARLTAGERPIALASPTGSISPNHLKVGLDLEGVWAEDTFSANGTMIRIASGSTFPIERGHRVPVPPDATLILGNERAVTIRREPNAVHRLQEHNTTRVGRGPTGSPPHPSSSTQS